jgi:hypothetical protein
MMKLMKGFLLSSIASIAAIAQAQAADLPMTKAAPVDYVRVCSAQGTGFFYVPGTDSCLRIGGRLRIDYGYAQPLWSTPGNGRRKDAIGFHDQARLIIDSRTATEFGTVRAFFRVDTTRDTGIFNNGFAAGSQVKTSLDKAFIQFAGITAGVAQSMFDFFAEDWNYGSAPNVLPGSDAGTTQMLAYTATFGNGFSATLSLEDRNQRNVGTTAVFNGAGDVLYGYDPAGERMPDVVGVLRVDQSWGSAQLSGAVHQMNSWELDPFGNRVDDQYGYAVQAGVHFFLPQLAAGDNLWLEAAYAQGALNYLGVTGDVSMGQYADLISSDGTLVDGSVKRTTGYNVLAAFTHYWTPSIRSGVWGSYTDVNYPGTVTAPSYSILRDFKVYQLAGQLVWSPTKLFDIGVEVLYAKVDAGQNGNPNLIVKGSQDQWQTRLRFQRDF